jgi:hypothetical protein
MSSSNLTEALAQLKEALSQAEEPGRAVREAASDYGLHPALVERKFTEATGKSPAAWQDEDKANKARAADMATQAVLNAQARARRLAHDRWRVQGIHADLAGKLFTLRDGRQYAYVVYADDHPDWAIRAVRVQDGREVNFAKTYWVEIMEQIAPNARLVA